jgi:hypothetical protein
MKPPRKPPTDTRPGWGQHELPAERSQRARKASANSAWRHAPMADTPGARAAFARVRARKATP